MSRRLHCLLVIALLLGTAVLTGCQKTAVPPPAAPHDAKPQIAFVYKTLANPFFLEMSQGAHQAADEEGVSLSERACINETQVDEQIRLVDELIHLKIAGICLTPIDSVRLAPAVKRAEQAGIPVLLVDNSLDAAAVRENQLRTPVLKTDNLRATYDGLKQILAPLNEPFEAAILTGLPDSDSSIQRQEGALRAFAEKPNIRVVAAVNANFRASDGYLQTKRILEQHPTLHFLFAANDLMALGAIQYLQEAGRGDILVVGYDGIPEAIDAIKAGRMRASIRQQASQMGYDAVKLMQRMLAGQPLPPLTLMQTIVVDKNTLR